MCDIVAATLSVASTLYSGLAAQNAAKQQAQIARAQSEAQAKAYEQNADMARQEAEATADAGRSAERKLRQDIASVQGSQNAAFGANGLSLASGSPLDVSIDTAVRGEEDVDMLRKNYQRKKFGLMNEASMYGWQANETRKAGQAVASAYSNQGDAALFGSLLGAAGTVASKWDVFKNGFK